MVWAAAQLPLPIFFLLCPECRCTRSLIESAIEILYTIRVEKMGIEYRYLCVCLCAVCATKKLHRFKFRCVLLAVALLLRVCVVVFALLPFRWAALIEFHTNKLSREPMGLSARVRVRGKENNENRFFNQTMFALYGLIILFLGWWMRLCQMCVLSPKFQTNSIPFFPKFIPLLLTSPIAQ